MTKKIIAVFLICAMLILFSSAVATHADIIVPTTYLDEEFIYEELIPMDQELDSDGDGIVDVIEIYYGFDHLSADTDGDTVSDYIEFTRTCTDVLTADGQIDSDGDGLTNAQEVSYGTDPGDWDSDNDGVGDYDEIMVYQSDPTTKDHNSVTLSIGNTNVDAHNDPLLGGSTPYAAPPLIDDGGLGGSGIYSTTLTTNLDGRVTSNVSYTFQQSWFFDSNTQYNRELSVLSSLLSSIAYDGNYLGNTSTSASNPATAVEDWFDYHLFSGYDCFDLDNESAYDYQDCHVSEMFVAYKKLYRNSSAKTLVCVVIRGTNGTLDEWQSNFDMGNSEEICSGWTNPANHKGFDITANRLKQELDQYLVTNNLSGDDLVFWITGHSRGGALANVLAAKEINQGRKVFAYTFAAPATTTAPDAQSHSAYQCIFNILNEDDLVTMLPLETWGFTRYGVNKSASIETSTGYAAAWDELIDGNIKYKSSTLLIGMLVAELENISSTRNGCYVFRTDNTGYKAIVAFSTEKLELKYLSQINLYPETTQAYWYSEYEPGNSLYTYRIYQNPAFFMQLLANVKGNPDFPVEDFVLLGVATYLLPSKYLISASYFFAEHPHYTESYYLLANLIEG